MVYFEPPLELFSLEKRPPKLPGGLAAFICHLVRDSIWSFLKELCLLLVSETRLGVAHEINNSGNYSVTNPNFGNFGIHGNFGNPDTL